MLKKSKYLLTTAWLLLFCFIAGQVIVYSHQHHTLKHADLQRHTDNYPHQTVAEKCLMCDAMQNTDMWHQQDEYITFLQPVTFTHPVVSFHFKSFGLILADGLSPPLS